MANTAPDLLNDDGSASMATAFMMTHHGFRRDIALFARALAPAATIDAARAAALLEEWKGFHAKLHGHHEQEDQRIFPTFREQHTELAGVVDQLSADHKRLDPLLAAGERAFAQLPIPGPAAALVSEVAALLDRHLALEETHVVPTLRPAKQFPAPASDAEAEMYAQGFAWACHGIAPEVLAEVDRMLPEVVRSRLPAARIAFTAAFERMWGTVGSGASRTAKPDWLG